MFFKRILFFGISALMTFLVGMVVNRLMALGFQRATGMPPPED